VGIATLIRVALGHDSTAPLVGSGPVASRHPPNGGSSQRQSLGDVGTTARAWIEEHRHAVSCLDNGRESFESRKPTVGLAAAVVRAINAVDAVVLTTPRRRRTSCEATNCTPIPTSPSRSTSTNSSVRCGRSTSSSFRSCALVS